LRCNILFISPSPATQKRYRLARENGIIVKGDVPIGIGRHSCDAWINPALYNMHLQAGAPPDGFAMKARIGVSPHTTGKKWPKMVMHGGTTF